MPEATRKIFISAFSRLPQRVVWKWENASDGMPDLPPNVRLCAWLPPMLGIKINLDNYAIYFL
jgi:glucuronosyltransferase